MKELAATDGNIYVQLFDRYGKPVDFDNTSYTLRRGDKSVPLTATDFILLLALASNADSLVSYYAMNYRLRPDEPLPNGPADLEGIRVRIRPDIYRLRKKLDEVGLSGQLEGVRGDGYALKTHAVKKPKIIHVPR